MPRLKLTIAYVGTNFSGWQTQEYTTRKRPRTVQEELEKACSKIAGERVRIHGAGRTDAGVHAEAQVAHVDVPDLTRSADWHYSLNALLPPDIAISAIEEVADATNPSHSEFHARFNAKSKTYAYSLWLTKKWTPPRLAPFVWACGALNLECIRSALPLLIGQRDYSLFQNRGSHVAHCVRNLMRIEMQPHKPDPHWPLVTLHFTADGFLKQMVRNLTGLLIHIGQKKLPPHAIPELLQHTNRQALLCPTAPAQGLSLLRIEY